MLVDKLLTHINNIIDDPDKVFTRESISINTNELDDAVATVIDELKQADLEGDTTISELVDKEQFEREFRAGLRNAVLEGVREFNSSKDDDAKKPDP